MRDALREGIIVAGISSDYEVCLAEGNVRCKARGAFRKAGTVPLIGDRVEISDKLYVERILPRRNELIRPRIANVDQAALIMAAHTPEPSAQLLDRFLAQVLNEKIEPIICFNKWDLAEEDAEAERLGGIYRNAGFHVLYVSARKGLGVRELARRLEGKTTVFAGPSGVGKSSLLNAIIPGLGQETGELSQKIQRGKNTTRHARLIPLADGGFVADTPGFTSLYLDHLRYTDLADFYPEFARWKDRCRFRGCSHVSEPDCAVKEGVLAGAIAKERYESYAALYREIRASNEERRYS